MTYRRVVIVVIGIWMYSVFVSLMILWELLSTRDLVGTINFAFSFIITFVVYIKIYLTVRRHKNHTQSMQIRNEAQSEEIKTLLSSLHPQLAYSTYISCFEFVFCPTSFARLLFKSTARVSFFFYEFSRTERRSHSTRQKLN